MSKTEKMVFWEKHQNKIILTCVIFLPVFLVLIFGSVGRIISTFVLFFYIFWICSYALRPYTKLALSGKGDYKPTLWQEFLRIYFCVVPWKMDENFTKWNKKFIAIITFARTVGLVAGIGLLFLFVPFVEDVAILIGNGSSLGRIEGKVVTATNGFGALDPIFMSVNLDNSKDEKNNLVNFYFFYSLRFLRIGDVYTFSYLRKSKLIVDVEKNE